MNKKRIFWACILVVIVATLAWAGTVSVQPYGISTPKWYGYSSGAKATYYLAAPTLSSNDTAVGLAVTQTLTNKTLTSPTITGSTLTTSTLTSPVINTSVSGTAFLDEDTLSSDSATKLASQKSIKAYVDAQKIYLTGEIKDISTAASSYIISPIAADLTAAWVLTDDGSIYGSDSIITFEIGGVLVDDGSVTIPNGTAAGTVKSNTFSATNALTAGQALEVITDGASDGTYKGVVVVELSP